MNLRGKVIAGLAVLAMGAVPALAAADGPDYAPDHPTPPPPQAHAYGYWCKGESKKHVEGEKGTAFSRCVLAHERAANQPEKTPREVCKDLKVRHDRSGRHVAHGDKGTAFSRCVKEVAQQRREEQQEQEAAQS